LFEGFLNRCFVKEAQHRANAEELIKMEWFSKTLTHGQEEQVKKANKKIESAQDSKNPPVQSDGEISDVGSGKETLSSSDEASEAQPKKQTDKNKEEIVGGVGEQTAEQSNTGANSEQKIAENTSQVPSDQNTSKVDSHEDDEEDSEASDDDKEDLNTLKSTFKKNWKDRIGKTSQKKSEESDDDNTNDVVNPGVPTSYIDKKDGSVNDVVKHKPQAKPNAAKAKTKTLKEGDELSPDDNEKKKGHKRVDKMFSDEVVDFDGLEDNFPQQDESEDDDWGEEDDGNDEYQDGKNIHDSLKKLDELITESSGAHMENINVAEVQEAFKDIEESFKARPDLVCFFYLFCFLNDIIKIAVIPIMELLQSRNVEVVKCVTRTITLLINDAKNGKKFLDSSCLVQFVPSLGEILNSDNSDIANAASPFLTRLCDKRNMSAFSRKMFIASGGLNILASALKKKYSRGNKPLIFCALDCISMIFFKEKMAQIFFKVAEIIDRVVKRTISKEMKHGVLPSYLLIASEFYIIIVELSRNAEGIQQLMNHHVIASVCPFLNSEDTDIQICIVMVLFYMTLMHQQQSAFIRENRKAMYLLVLAICRFIKNAIDFTIFELKKHSISKFYLDMTKPKNVLTQMRELTTTMFRLCFVVCFFLKKCKIICLLLICTIVGVCIVSTDNITQLISDLDCMWNIE
ncbi:hypothetical protein RFI_31173, partial [Reticulomyxa filosa]